MDGWMRQAWLSLSCITPKYRDQPQPCPVPLASTAPHSPLPTAFPPRSSTSPPFGVWSCSPQSWSSSHQQHLCARWECCERDQRCSLKSRQNFSLQIPSCIFLLTLHSWGCKVRRGRTYGEHVTPLTAYSHSQENMSCEFPPWGRPKIKSVFPLEFSKCSLGCSWLCRKLTFHPTAHKGFSMDIYHNNTAIIFPTAATII